MTSRSFRRRGSRRVAVCLGAALGLTGALGVARVASAAGCAVTFRHGGTLRAARCHETDRAIALLVQDGWVVVPTALVAAVADEAGARQLHPPWTADEERRRLAALPTEGGVPLGPTGVEPPLPPPPPVPQVVYVPVPVPQPQPVYQVPAPAAVYPVPLVLRAHRHGPSAGRPRPPFVRVVPTDPRDIGPMAIQRTFPPIIPPR